MPYDRRHGPWNLDVTGAELADEDGPVDRKAIDFGLAALREAPEEDHAMLIDFVRGVAKKDEETREHVERALADLGLRSLRDIHLELEAHRKAGTLTPEVRARLIEEERAMSPGGVLECGTSWLDD